MTIQYLKKCFPFFDTSSSHALPVQQISEYTLSEKINTWMLSSHERLSRLQHLFKNGLSSLIDKEISLASKLIVEGTAFTNISPLSALLKNRVDVLIRPQIHRLQTLADQAQQSFLQDKEAVKKDIRLEEKWKKLGLPESVLEKHADCARFLMESSLIFAMIGYQESYTDPRMHGLWLDTDGHPLIKVKGHWTRWEVIKNQLRFDPHEDKIKSKDYPGSIAQTWSYLSNGLVPIDRFYYDKAYPIHELSENEYNRLIQQAKRFYETNPEIDVGIPKDCVVQFFTTPRRQGVFPVDPGIFDSPLYDNLVRQFNVHIGIRLITQDHKVYSFGYQMPPDEQQKVLKDMPSTLLSTALTRISMFDFEEFRDHEGRIVTSIPLSSQRAQNILYRINELNGQQLRFNFLRQNCSSLMDEVMGQAGYAVDLRTTPGEIFRDALPSLHHLPWIGPVLGKVEKCIHRIWNTIVNATPMCVRDGFSFVVCVIFYIPGKLGTICANLLVLKMGGNKYTSPLVQGVEEEPLYDKRKIQNFSCLIRSPVDLLKEETSKLKHSKFFIDWQNKQHSTYVFKPEARPRFCIVPAA